MDYRMITRVITMSAIGLLASCADPYIKDGEPRIGGDDFSELPPQVTRLLGGDRVRLVQVVSETLEGETVVETYYNGSIMGEKPRIRTREVSPREGDPLISFEVEPVEGRTDEVGEIKVEAFIPAGLIGEEEGPFEVQSVGVLIKSGEASCYDDFHYHGAIAHEHQVCWP